MKITKIERDILKYNIFLVTIEYNWFERLLGHINSIYKFKDTGSTYSFGGGSVYVDKEGKLIGNHSKIGDAIDAWRNRITD